MIHFPRTMAAAAFLAGAFALAPFAAQAATPATMVSTSPAKTATDRVEARISGLHTRLAITPAQEGLWAPVAGQMRDSAKTMTALSYAWLNAVQPRTAIDDLKSYSDLAGAHADSTKSFVPVFSALYASMTPAQQLTADGLFNGSLHTARAMHAKPAAGSATRSN